jgi:hypothetical protein
VSPEPARGDRWTADTKKAGKGDHASKLDLSKERAAGAIENAAQGGLTLRRLSGSSRQVMHE